MVQHRPETDAADIPVGRSVNRVAEGHVVSRHRLCDCARGAADKKEPARDFLAGSNFREGPVTFGVEINLERLLVRPDIHLGFHNFQDVGIYRLLNRRVANGSTAILAVRPTGILPVDMNSEEPPRFALRGMEGCASSAPNIWDTTARVPPIIASRRSNRVKFLRTRATIAPFPPRLPQSTRVDHSAAPRNSSLRAPVKSKLRFQPEEPERFAHCRRSQLWLRCFPQSQLPGPVRGFRFPIYKQRTRKSRSGIYRLPSTTLYPAAESKE